MRVDHLLPVLLLVAVGACGDDGLGGVDSVDPTPSPVISTTSPSGDQTLAPRSTAPPGTPTATAPASTVALDESALPSNWFRYGADGLFLASADGDQMLHDRPIGWAASDGAGGVLFTEWSPDRFGPTWWLPGGASAPVIVSEWDDPLIAARVDGQPAAVGSLPTVECDSNGGVDMVARVLPSDRTETLQCGVGGHDAGREPDSFGGGIYVGVEWDAVHSSGRTTAVKLVFRDADGEIVDLATNPYADDCSPCELAAALSPDGHRLAVVHRPDAAPVRPEEYDVWLASTADVDAELRVVDLTTGDTSSSRSLPAGAHPMPGSWFDGRFVVLAPDTTTHPWMSPGDRGEAVATLQRLLGDHGADIDVDGIFGPDTQAAVEAFHAARFGRERPTVGPDTWAELGVPTTIIDTDTGVTTKVPGRVVLDLILTDGPAATPDTPVG